MEINRYVMPILTHALLFLWDDGQKNYENQTQAAIGGKRSCDVGEIRVSGDVITTKWQNLRDAFVRSLKKKSGQGVQRKYLYHDQLQFLLKIVSKDETVSSIPETAFDNDSTEDYQNDSLLPLHSTPPTSEDNSRELKRRRNSKGNKRDPIEEEILKKLRESSPPPDEDQAFFQSVIPSVRKMSEDEKMEFRMGVLQLLHKIKQKRQFNSASGTYYMHSRTYSSDSSEFSRPVSPQLSTTSHLVNL
ncbi:hypothetical protein FQR65_LT03842 [Abscondita terminalis]|nr:hypothetical protein FQR65_LT03842 [Abscondita terminalis]